MLWIAGFVQAQAATTPLPANTPTPGQVQSNLPTAPPQTTVGMPSLGAACFSSTSVPSHQSSDMSMDADPATGYSLYFNGRWVVFGGTSFVAPELVGLFAIVVKANGVSSQSVPGVIWCLAGKHIATPSAFNDFTDITSGANSTTPWAAPSMPAKPRAGIILPAGARPTPATSSRMPWRAAYPRPARIRLT